MVNFYLNAVQWNNIKNNALISRDNFEQEIITFVFINSPYTINVTDLNIVLPKEVSRMERYRIHQYTVNKHFVPESIGDDPNRIMTIFISKKYVQEMYNKYFVLPTQVHVSVTIQRTEKEQIFDSFIEFLQKDFKDEFEEYIKNF